MFAVANVRGKGNGLVATQNIPRNSGIFEEMPLVVAQFLYNQKFFAACSHCLRSLESADGILMRLAGIESKPELPFLAEFEQTLPAKPASACPECQELYCCEECRLEARSYHQRLCVGPNAKPGNAIYDLKAWWQTFHYPPEELSPMLLLRVVSVILSDLDRGVALEDALKQWHEFSGQTTSPDSSVLIRFLDKEFQSRIHTLIEYVRLALYDARCPQLFEPASIVALMA